MNKPPNRAPLNPLEQYTISSIRAMVCLGPHPDPSVLCAVSETAREAQEYGLPFDGGAVLESLYPAWSQDRPIPAPPTDGGSTHT